MSLDKSINERVSILEVQVDNHASRLEENQQTSNKLIERLDSHMVASAERDAVLQSNLVQVTLAVTKLSTTVEHTNDTLKKIAGIVEEDNQFIRDWRAVAKAGAKAASIVATLVGALWVGGTYIIDHQDTAPINKVIK